MTNLGLRDLGFLGGLKGGAETDPYINNVVLLLNGNGTNGSTAFVDSSPSPKTVAAVGNAQLTTSRSVFGGASLALDGNGDYLDISYSNDLILSGDCTIEFWLWVNSFYNGPATGLVGSGWAPGSLVIWVDHELARGKLMVGADWQLSPTLVSSSTVPTNTWNFVALTRSGNTWTLYLNANIEAVVTNYQPSITRPFRVVGTYMDGTNDRPNFYLPGNMLPLRVTKGVARTITSVPTAPFPTS